MNNILVITVFFFNRISALLILAKTMQSVFLGTRSRCTYVIAKLATLENTVKKVIMLFLITTRLENHYTNKIVYKF